MGDQAALALAGAYGWGQAKVCQLAHLAVRRWGDCYHGNTLGPMGPKAALDTWLAGDCSTPGWGLLDTWRLRWGLPDTWRLRWGDNCTENPWGRSAPRVLSPGDCSTPGWRRYPRAPKVVPRYHFQALDWGDKRAKTPCGRSATRGFISPGVCPTPGLGLPDTWLEAVPAGTKSGTAVPIPSTRFFQLCQFDTHYRL